MVKAFSSRAERQLRRSQDPTARLSGDMQPSSTHQLPLVHGQPSDVSADAEVRPKRRFHPAEEESMWAIGANVFQSAPALQQQGAGAGEMMQEQAHEISAAGRVVLVPGSSIPANLGFDYTKSPTVSPGQHGWREDSPSPQCLTHNSESATGAAGVSALQTSGSQQVAVIHEAPRADGSIPRTTEGGTSQNITPMLPEEGASAGRLIRKRPPRNRSLVAVKQYDAAPEMDSTGSPPAKKARLRAAPKARVRRQKKAAPPSPEEGCLEEATELPKDPLVSGSDSMQKVVFITASGHMQGSTPARLRSAEGTVEVMAKMYFHRKKLAWRAEVLINGTKRQKSFSCKVYFPPPPSQAAF